MSNVIKFPSKPVEFDPFKKQIERLNHEITIFTNYLQEIKSIAHQMVKDNEHISAQDLEKCSLKEIVRYYFGFAR